MSSVFLKIVNMSITASWLILAVVLVRMLLKKAPKWIPCLLWGLVAIRLICPISFGSVFSLIPSSETIPTNITVQREPAINSGITIVNDVINPMIAESFAPSPADSVNPLQIIIPVAAIVWLSGIVIMLAYARISCIKLKKMVSICVPVGERILSCDEVKAPFILGVFRPAIYVPSSMSGETLELVIRHETAHLQRHDHWWKPLGYLLLAVYWFNPMCWIAYILLCRDIEMACDEKVIRDMDKDEMAAYSQALLDCSFPRRRIAACPLAFGEVGVKERVKGVLNYRKPTFWVILIAVIACIVLAVCLMTDPFSNKSLSGKLGVSMDMAVAEHNHDSKTDGHFVAIDYDVLRVSKSFGRTTVYAWVMYEEYSFDGIDVKEESGSHIPTVITFDTSSEDSDKSTYDVIEYWEPRDGSYFSEDIRSKFPLSIRAKAFDVSGADQQHENCLKAAREYYGVGQNTVENPLTQFYLTIGADNIKSIMVSTPYTSGGCQNADGSLYHKGEQIWLELLDGREDLRGVTITAMDASETVIWTASVPNTEENRGFTRLTQDGWTITNIRDTSDVVFNIRYELGTTAHVFTSTPSGAKAGEKVEIKSDVLFDADIHVYVDGQEIGKTHYDSDYWGYSFIMPNKDVLVTARFYTKDEIWGTETADLDSLREKYPEYFELDTFKGLEVYVWQIVPNSYSCGVLPGTNREKTLEELLDLKDASIAEMRAILSTYDIDESEIFVIPWQNPVSSYIPDFWIREIDEDPGSLEKRQQEYVDGIRQMLFGETEFDAQLVE